MAPHGSQDAARLRAAVRRTFGPAGNTFDLEVTSATECIVRTDERKLYYELQPDDTLRLIDSR